MPIPPEFLGAPPLDPRRGFAPRPHANLRHALPDRKYHLTYLEKRSAGPA